MGFVEPTKFTWAVDPESGRRVKKASRGTKWKARYTDPAGRDRRKTFDRRSDAERFLERIGTSMQTGEWVDPRADKSRFDEWADTWWATTVKLAPSTRRGYERMLRVHLTPQFSRRKINSIDWVEVELFATSMLDNGSSPKTVRETISVLSLIMQTAMRAQIIRENPAAGRRRRRGKCRMKRSSTPAGRHVAPPTTVNYSSQVSKVVRSETFDR
jgi:Phage integrase, N-terminal SAM-like domain